MPHLRTVRQLFKRRSFTRGQMAEMRDIAIDENARMKGARAWKYLDTISYLALVVMIALAVRAFVVEPVRVDGTSMDPTLEHREMMFVEKLSLWKGMPARGDIVICFYPGYKDSCVKRAIALPGETISVIDGNVWIDGKKLDESAYWNDYIEGDFEGVTVGKNELFVMGDNRNASKDSRNPSVGSIPMGHVIGHARAVFWPLTHFRTLGRVEYPS